MEIYCDDLDQFNACIASAVMQGLGFKAYSDTLIIKFTGAY